MCITPAESLVHWHRQHVHDGAMSKAQAAPCGIGSARTIFLRLEANSSALRFFRSAVWVSSFSCGSLGALATVIWRSGRRTDAAGRQGRQAGPIRDAYSCMAMRRAFNWGMEPDFGSLISDTPGRALHSTRQMPGIRLAPAQSGAPHRCSGQASAAPGASGEKAARCLALGFSERLAPPETSIGSGRDVGQQEADPAEGHYSWRQWVRLRSVLLPA